MYVVLTNDDNTLSAPKKQRIVQRSKLVDDFCFLVKPMYNGHDMTGATVLLEYLKPVSKKYRTEILRLSDEGYEDHLKYLLPVDTEITDEAGSLELQLSYIYVDMDVDGNVVQKVRKTAPALKINIVPISAWSDIIPDSALSSLDQRIIKMDAQIKAIDDMNAVLNDTKADNIVYEDNKLQLTANGNKIGNPVDIEQCNNDCIEDGVPVVDFSNSTDFVTPDDSVDTDNGDNLNDNVVEFDPFKVNNNLNNVIEF